MTQDKLIANFEKRIARLEKAVLGKGGHQAQKQPAKGFTGATGGVRFLVSKGFFKKKHALLDVRTALANNGYHYSRQAVHVALNNLTAKGGPLVSLQEGGRKVYVERK